MRARALLTAAIASISISLALPTVTPAKAEWALAFGRYGQGGWGAGADKNKATVSDAAIGAIQNCRGKAPSCVIIGKGLNGCVALAVVNGADGWGYGRATTLQGAKNLALVKCTQANPAGGCSVKLSFCDTTNGFKYGTIEPKPIIPYARTPTTTTAVVNGINSFMRGYYGGGGPGRVFPIPPTPQPTYRPLPQRPYVQAPVRTAAPAHATPNNCPGAELAVDANCRPLH